MVCVERNQKSVGLKLLFLTMYRTSADSKAGADRPTLENAKAAVGLVNHAPDHGPNIPKGTAGSPKRCVLFQEESPLDNR